VLPEDTAVTSIFEAWVATLAGETDLLADQRYTRAYTLTLIAKPYTRSVDQVRFPALAKPAVGDDPIVTVLDDCTSTTGWTGSPNAPTTSDGAVVETRTTFDSSRLGSGPFLGAPGYTMTLTRTFGSAVDMTDTPYLEVMAGMPGVDYTLNVYADNVRLTLVAQSERHRWYKAPASFTTVKVEGKFFTRKALTVPLRVYELVATDQAGPVASTTREIARTVWVQGSARTYGSIDVGDPDTGLGDVLVWTGPSSSAGYTPAMRGYQTDGPTPTTDTGAVTGLKQAIDLSSVGEAGDVFPIYTIPANQLVEGDYGVAIRVRVNTPDTYRFTITAGIEGLTDAPTSTLQSTILFADDDYAIVWLGLITLPPAALSRTSDTNVQVQILATLQAFEATDPVYLDEMWLLNLTDGSVSIVRAGARKRLWLDSPDDDRVNPTVWLGDAADKSDAFGADLATQVIALGRHALLPGYMDMLTVTTGADNADAGASYYRRWHTHAAL
jgi:hypothetical protein